ncbi:hypothetical protein C440_08007 [Haloferax mucosum ATCC BAA-1512]|uniref:Uncharacterized protein n=1 Tax=Haloferax mucosum ATCC BAA-1512 TaxID=662479 RepID=M0IHU3_9EURY|nr:hypothetical protein [Haloferax mucosum]ELZ95004.1 hypothetical protein C440_08007 [Haloferax mucosum ATCC BAA-1512]
MTDNDPLDPTDNPTSTDDQTRFRARLDETFADTAETGKKLGEGSGKVTAMALKGLLSLVAIPLYLVLRIVPKSHKLGEALVDAGYKTMLKTTGADTIVNTIYGDGVVKPIAGSWHSEEHEYQTTDGQAYKADRLGFPYRQNGKYSMVWALREGREITDPLEAYMGAQRRLGNYDEHLRTDGSGKDVAIHAETDGYEGRALSFRDGWRLFGSKVTQQDMKRQETRGKLAELDWSTRQQLYLVLIFGGGLALGMFGPALATSIAGGGGGGGIGGGISLPLFINSLPGVF